MHGTAIYSRVSVKPGMRVKFQGKEWTASANVAKGLYLYNLYAQVKTQDDWIEVCLNSMGTPAGEYYRGKTWTF